MKEFFENNADKIWYLLCVIIVAVGIFVDAFFGLLCCVLIGIHFYIVFSDKLDRNFTKSDSIAVNFISTLLHMTIYVIIIGVTSIVVDKEEIKVSNSYEVKYLEHEKIIISKNNNLEVISDAKLYWECRAKNCKDIVITNIRTKPSNSIYSDLLTKSFSVLTVN